MSRQSASEVMEELIAELAKSPQRNCERVVELFSGGIKSGTGTGDSPETRAIHARADALIEELREAWGPTADPNWADDVIPGRHARASDQEEDCLFALFRRPGIWGYVRMRALRD